MVLIKHSIALTLVGAAIIAPAVVALPISHVAPAAGPNIFRRELDSSSQQHPHTQESHTPEIYPRSESQPRIGSPTEHYDNGSRSPSPQPQANQPQGGAGPPPGPPPGQPR